MAKSKFIKKVMVFGWIAVFLGLVITFWGVVSSMKMAANDIGENAANAFHKDKVESLLLLIDSDKHSLKEKNDAIWALGVLKDRRALSKLESLASGSKSDQAEKLCLSEIEKSISKIKGKFILSWPMECNSQ